MGKVVGSTTARHCKQGGQVYHVQPDSRHTGQGTHGTITKTVSDMSRVSYID